MAYGTTAPMASPPLRRRSTRRCMPSPRDQRSSLNRFLWATQVSPRLTGEETGMIKSATCTAFIVALMASGAAPASAQVPGDQPIVGISLESSTPIVAKVAGVDPSGGTVTLMLAGGTTETRKVSSLVKLGQLKVGDVVNVTYKERLTFIVSEPNAKTPPGYEAVAE